MDSARAARAESTGKPAGDGHGRFTGERHDHAEGVVAVMADPENNEFCPVRFY